MSPPIEGASSLAADLPRTGPAGRRRATRRSTGASVWRSSSVSAVSPSRGEPWGGVGATAAANASFGPELPPELPNGPRGKLGGVAAPTFGALELDRLGSEPAFADPVNSAGIDVPREALAGGRVCVGPLGSAGGTGIGPPLIPREVPADKPGSGGGLALSGARNDSGERSSPSDMRLNDADSDEDSSEAGGDF